MIALAVLTAGVLVAVDPNAMCLLPMLALALPLWLRRYPGERTLAALIERGAEQPRRGLAPVRASLPWMLRVVRGGLLLACSLAVRPPPQFHPVVAR
ncbi:MAG TPA: hypothetical protein VHU13_06745 [Solirubrobacteraceae bacterium]|nr:hypothetical protein [Solirubrobacteraceae bacterium]